MRATGKLLRRLRGARPFAHLSEEALRRLLAYAQVEELARGAVLFREGAQSEFVHYVLEGSIGLAASAEKPEGTIVEIFREDEIFVAPAAMLRLPYLVSAVVLAPARVLAIPAAVFRAVLERDPGLARGMAEVLARHWRLLVEQLKDLKLRTAGERRPGELASRRQAGKDARLRARIHGGAVDLPGRAHLRRRQAGVGLFTLALERRRIEPARARVFD